MSERNILTLPPPTHCAEYGEEEVGWEYWMDLHLWTLSVAVYLGHGKLLLALSEFHETHLEYRTRLSDDLTYRMAEAAIRDDVLSGVRTKRHSDDPGPRGRDVEVIEVRPIEFLRWWSTKQALPALPEPLRAFLDAHPEEAHKEGDREPHGNRVINARKKGEIIGIARACLARSACFTKLGVERTTFVHGKKEVDVAKLARFIEEWQDDFWPETGAHKPKYALKTIFKHLRDWRDELPTNDE